MNIISPSTNSPNLSIDMGGAQPELPGPTLMLWNPPNSAFHAGDVCTTLHDVAIRASEDLDSPLTLKMTAGIRVLVIAVGVHENGRRVQIRTLTFTGPAEGWVSVATPSGHALLEPVAAHGFQLSPSRSKSAPKVRPTPPPAKRGREANVAENENIPAPRRRRYWF